jgi:sister-chromatid-cohesion protein PDS5
MYVLTSLAEVKSVVLITDVNNSEALLLHLFTIFFDIVSGSAKASTGEQLSKNAEFHMNEILVTLVDEAPTLPTEVIDIIVAQFLRAAATGKAKQNGDSKDDKQSTLEMKELPAAYKMAEFLCNSCPEKMSRYISQYFNDVIVDASSSGSISKPGDHRRSSINNDSDDEDENTGPTVVDLRELEKAHRLLRELWRASSQVLQNVIPQLEAELSAENVQLRLLATETLGDIISGIGAAGPPPAPPMDPAAYPPVMLEEYAQPTAPTNILTTPMSPQSFAQAYPAVYNSFLSRKNDKSPLIRSAWTTAIGRIILTSAGGIGLSREDEATLVAGLAEKLNDADERVRIAAVKAVGGFGFHDIATKLASSGDVNKTGSVLCSLADRSRDRKHAVRVEGMTTISKIWGVAAGEIAAGNETVTALLGAIPSRIFYAYYANDQDVNVLLDHVMFEQLLPLSYPPLKSKGIKKANGESQQATDDSFDPNTARVERLLILVRSLDPKAKKAFFALQARQKTFRNVMTTFLTKCEEYNGGVMDGNEKEIKQKLTAVIQWLVALLPDSLRAGADLWKFAKMHDRRAYHLIRCTMDPIEDFKTVHKAVKEFAKRIEAAPGAPAGLLETMIPLIYRAGSIVYNQSNLPAILEFSRNDAKGLGATAHELLNEISERNPDIFKAQVKDLCKLLVEAAPTATKANDVGSVKTLKSCAAFAKKFPDDIPKDKPFVQALVAFAKFGSPAKAAKHAVTILISTTARKEVHARDLLTWATKDWTYGEDHYLTKLACISQLTLLAPTVMDEFHDSILEITSQQVLLQYRTTPSSTDRSWVDDAAVDAECEVKIWSLKALVNRLRVVTDPASAAELAPPVYKLLLTLLTNEGELSKTASTPKHHKSRLRLLAAHLLLKLSTTKAFDAQLSPKSFLRLATVAQDALFPVRRRFIDKLQKYLVLNRLPTRFYTIPFLLAFEPEAHFRASAATWLKSRARALQGPVGGGGALEATLPRLLSLLAHHPDYSPEPADLLDTAQYLLFFVSSVATEENLGLLYKYAERVKQARDALDPASENIYVLAELAMAVLRKWEARRGWAMQAYAGRLGMARELFAKMPDHKSAQETAEKVFLPEGVEEGVEGVVRKGEKRGGKRGAGEGGGEPAGKRQRVSNAAAVGQSKTKVAAVKKVAKPKTPKTPKVKKVREEKVESTAERRRSGRGVVAKTSYADRDDSEDDEEMMGGVSKWEYEDGHVESDAAAESEDESDAEASEAAEEEDVEMSDDAVKESEETPAPAIRTKVPEPAKEEPEVEEEEEATPEPVEKPANGRGRKAAAVKAKPKGKENIKAPAAPVRARSARASGKKAGGDVFDVEASE